VHLGWRPILETWSIKFKEDEKQVVEIEAAAEEADQKDFKQKATRAMTRKMSVSVVEQEEDVPKEYYVPEYSLNLIENVKSFF